MNTTGGACKQRRAQRMCMREKACLAASVSLRLRQAFSRMLWSKTVKTEHILRRYVVLWARTVMSVSSHCAPREMRGAGTPASRIARINAGSEVLPEATSNLLAMRA